MATKSRFPAALNATEEDISLLLTAQAHIGTKNCDKQMASYVWKRRSDGIHLINIGKTWEKITLAARVIASIETPNDVCVISARPYGHRAVLKFASATGAQAIAGRFTPGSFTNYITRSFKEPRLVVVTDPRTDAQAIREASYTNIPVIAFCDTDAPMAYVDIAIPVNNKGKHSIGLVWWMLAREVLRLRGTYARSGENSWPTMVDMFFYRDPEESERQEQEAAAAKQAAAFGDAQEQVPNEWEVTGAMAGPALAVGQSAVPGIQGEAGLDWSADAAQTSDWAAPDNAGASWDAAAAAPSTQTADGSAAAQGAAQPPAPVASGWN